MIVQILMPALVDIRRVPLTLVEMSFILDVQVDTISGADRIGPVVAHMRRMVRLIISRGLTHVVEIPKI